MEPFYEPDEILQFWFPNEQYQKSWFIGNTQLDQEITNKYHWQMVRLFENFNVENYSSASANKIISDIILLDQFSRNISRVKTNLENQIPDYTQKAIELSKIWLKNKYYLTEPVAHTVFALMPIRHSKDKISISKLMPVLEEIKTINKNDSNPIFIKFYTHTLRALTLV